MEVKCSAWRHIPDHLREHSEGYYYLEVGVQVT
jgi:hypothetical protein